MTFTKDPDAVLDYSVDWTRWLDGDILSESQWIVPPDLVMEDEGKTSTMATVWLPRWAPGLL